MRCAISTSSPSRLRTTVLFARRVSVISLASSIEVGLITHTSIPAPVFLDWRIGVTFAGAFLTALSSSDAGSSFTVVSFLGFSSAGSS